MKIILAPDKFKSCLTAPEFCRIAEQAFREELPDAELVCLPLADGGDGTTRALAAATGAELHTIAVRGPLGKTVTAEFAFDPVTRNGIFETASASGLALLSRNGLNPMKATTFGTGEVLKKLLDLGAATITLGIGGSATIDGGAGMAKALGVRFLDHAGNELPADPGSLNVLGSIDTSRTDPRLKKTRILVACDVNSPLLGKDGAARVFGPQKGATPEMIGQLEKTLARLAGIWKKQGLIDRVDRPGDGASGGLGAGLRAFCGAELHPGAQFIMKMLHFEEHLKDAAFVITGEGNADSQTGRGKLCSEIAKVSRSHQVPVILIAGALTAEEGGKGLTAFHRTFDCAFSISPGPENLDSAKANAPGNLFFMCKNLARLIAESGGRRRNDL